MERNKGVNGGRLVLVTGHRYKEPGGMGGPDDGSVRSRKGRWVADRTDGRETGIALRVSNSHEDR